MNVFFIITHRILTVCFGFLLLCLSILSPAFTQSVRINEFMAINSSTLMDEDGDYSDWIELYNPATTSINLEGWSVTDDVGSPRKWVLPNLELRANSYLVLFASDKDRISPAELHLNFKLDGDGEYLALIDASGQVMSEFAPAFPEQFADVSFAYLDGAYVASTAPTPGVENRFEPHNKLAPPSFSHRRGFYETPFQVRLTSEIADAEIFYTLNGGKPTAEGGTRYNQPIPIQSTSILRAIVTSGELASAPITHTYIFLDDVITQPNNPPGYPEEWGPYTAISGTATADYEMDPEITEDPRYAPYLKDALLSIPTMSLVTKKENLFSHSTNPETGGIYIYTGPPEGGDVPGLGDDWERPASIEFFASDGSEEFQVNCGVRLQGGHSRRPEKSPKHSFRLVFKDEYGPTRLEYPLFGEDATSSFNTITLRAGFGNKWIHWSHAERRRGQYERDIWAKDTQLDMGHPAGHGRYVHLYVNGLYWGLYNPTERLDREFAESYLGGDDMDYDVIKDYTSVVDGSIDAWNRMMTLANRGLVSTENYQRFQGNNPDGTPNPDYEPYVDVVSLIDYMILNFYGGNTDWDHHNWVAIRNRVQPGKGFKFFSWDAEHVLKGLTQNVTNENNANCPSGLFQRLAENADFRRLFADRVQFHCFGDGALTPTSNHDRWMQRANQIELAVIAESARWGDYRRDVHRYREDGPFDLYDKQYWLDEQDYLMNDYFPSRTDRLISQLRAAGLFPDVHAPQFKLNGEPISNKIIEPGDVLSMSTESGSIYYTTNGADPLVSQQSAPGTETVLIEAHAQKRVLVPKSDISNSWRAGIEWDDSAWQLCRGAPGGVGYEKGSGYENLISLDVGDDMHNDGSNPNSSCYIRITFSLSADALSDIKSLVLNMRYDDGFVAYLNGSPVAQANAPANPDWDAAASDLHEDVGFEAFNVSEFINRLLEGDNLLAIHGLNRNTSSSDFLINATLVASDQANTGGAVSPDAVLYSDPIALSNSTHIKARTLLGNEWSALNDIMLVLPSDIYNVRLTEVHYHPLVQDTVENRSFEFLELKNIGPSPIDLSGARFIDGIDYTFPARTILNPQSFVVLASSPQQFTQRYGFPPFAQYEGFLANEGESIVLVDVSNDTLLFVDYDDQPPWPENADGAGHSLVTKEKNPGSNLNDPLVWRTSAAMNGSPGQDDPASTLVHNQEKTLPTHFRLEQNYPNPFNPETTISYAIPERLHVRLAIYDILGREIQLLINKVQDANIYSVRFDAANLPSGVYFYRLQAGQNEVEIKKMLLVR